MALCYWLSRVEESPIHHHGSTRNHCKRRQHFTLTTILRMKWFLFSLLILSGFHTFKYTSLVLNKTIDASQNSNNYSVDGISPVSPRNELALKQPNLNQLSDSLDSHLPLYRIGESSSQSFWPMTPDRHWDFMPRIFEFNKSKPSWCRDESKKGEGLLFAKVHKAASSTLAGINLRIARHHNCASANQIHDDSSKLRYRDRSKSFLYSSIRDPAQRALSWQMYVLSNRDQEINSENLMRMMEQKNYFVKAWPSSEDFKSEAGAQVGYLHPTTLPKDRPLWNPLQPDQIQNLTLAQLRVKQILDHYDFIMIVERLDESLVVLQLLLGLDPTDIVYVSSKQSGGYSYVYGPEKFKGCHKLRKRKTLPHEVQKYLSSPEWYATNYQDFLLYKAVNQSLDMTIENLGRNRFNRALEKYQTMMKQAKEECESEALFPCSVDGQPQLERTNCYNRDWGCGYECLDRLFTTKSR